VIDAFFSAHPAGQLVRVVALALVAIVVSTAPAAANGFTINACQADRANFSTQAFDDFATRGMIDALDHLPKEHVTVVVNKAHPHPADELRAVEACFGARRLHGAVTIPFDRRLTTMLDTGTYSLEALDPPTRLSVKRLGISVAEQLV
jgi:hypothetical protein